MILDGVRVLEQATGIAGPYCGKVLADAGADVVKVEPGSGDPLRRWRSGALFDFLNTSKRGVSDADGLLAGADVLVVDGPIDVAPLRADHPALVVVTVSPYGCDGPWADRPWTEFTLQAMAGSTGSRGYPDQPPIAAGGRIGEWVTGLYAAVAALAGWRLARRTGHGDHLDVAMLDAMAATMTTYPSLFAQLLGWPSISGTGRTVEVPSIEPTADGYAVVTTNSAQQFQDFLVVIGRADLLDDPDLASAPKRFARRDEYLGAVHAHTTKRTTAELLEECGTFRVPAAPVLDGARVPDFEQFTARNVFERSPTGRFRQPRVPYRIEGMPPRPFDPPPAVGADDGRVDWTARVRPSSPPAGEPGRALAGLRVLDCTAWWAGPVAGQGLALLGADVVKVESSVRPDGGRFVTVKPPTEPQWWEWGGLFQGANAGKRGVSIDLSRPEGVAAFEDLARTADVVIENYTPRVMDQFGLTWERLHAVNSSLVVVRMPAFGLDGPWRDRGGFAQTMEATSGLAWVTGFADGPPVLVRGACDPVAGMHAVVATLLALEQRDRDGLGRLVEATMVEAALNIAAEQVAEADATGTILGRNGNRSDVIAPQGLYRCAGDDAWLALGIADEEHWHALGELLGRPAWHADPDLATVEGRLAAHDGIDDELSVWCAKGDAAELAEQLSGAGVPAAAVIAAREVVRDPRLRERGLFEVVEHPVTGRHELPTMPFRSTHVDRWLQRAAPTIGQHDDEVLGEVLGLARLAALRDQGVVAEGLAGS